jgi:hypothetical protein
MKHEPIDWESISDDDFVKKAETQIWFSAFANNNPRAPAHKKTDAAYSEAQRREKPWLYKRAWNKAYRSCGYQPSDDDLEAAKEPQP